MALQIRAFSPTKFGIAKGVLMMKDDLDENTIELPTSMMKVGKSRSRKPLHDDVVLVISELFLSDKANTMNDILNPSSAPTKRNNSEEKSKEKSKEQKLLAKIEPPSETFLNLLMSRGVSEKLICDCK